MLRRFQRSPPTTIHLTTLLLARSYTSKPPPAGLAGNGVVAIRREDKNEWERRAPLSPVQVADLVSKGIRVIVQPSTIRCFTDREYADAGATIAEDLSPASTIISVKEVPASLLIPDRTYMMFSHTIKAQPHNMPLLDTILQKNIRLIDYERIVGPDGRIVKFGPFAGFAGVVDTLHGLGLALLARGFATPFLHVSFAKEYRSLETARADLLHLGELIRKRGLPKEICPLTFVVTGGSGSVSMAAQQMLHLLPCKYVECSELESLWKKETRDTHNIYVAVATAKDMVQPRTATNERFSKAHYYKNPDDYIGTFHETVIPYTRVLINGMYWEPKYPRLLSVAQAKQLQQAGRFPLVALGDITCDTMGSVEFLVKSTTIANPLFAFDVESAKAIELSDYTGKGVIILGVDHLPAEFPCESSHEFGANLVRLLEKIVHSDGTQSLEKQQASLGTEVFNAVVTSNGNLTQNFKYIQEIREKRESARLTSSSRRILVIGGGMCAGPCVRHLLHNQNNHVTVVDAHRHSVEMLIRTYARGGTGFGRDENERVASVRDVILDVSRDDQQPLLRSLIQQHDVVVSLLPAYLHSKVANIALEFGKHLATASYVSPEMRTMSDQAKSKNIILLNEMGLDPGIDIMSTMQMLHSIRSAGGVVRSYRSACGALPQPENSNCPLGYKFSWSPRGVLTAVHRPARVKADGKWQSIPGGEVYKRAQRFGEFAGLRLLCVPNGDAEEYSSSLFDFGPETTTIERLTLRYDAFPAGALALSQLGLLDDKLVIPELQAGNGRETTWASVLSRTAPSVVPDKAFDADTVKALRQLGILTPHTMAPQTPYGTPLDSLSVTLQEKLKYKPHERDMVLMVHEMVAEYTKNRKVLHRATLCVRGVSEAESATALTVGLPLGIAVQMLLDGELLSRGLVRPNDPALYGNVMKELYRYGIQMVEEEIEI